LKITSNLDTYKQTLIRIVFFKLQEAEERISKNDTGFIKTDFVNNHSRTNNV